MMMSGPGPRRRVAPQSLRLRTARALAAAERQPAEGQGLLREIVLDTRRALGDDHFETALAQGQFGILASAAGHFADALGPLRIAHGTTGRLLGADNLRTMELQVHIGNVLAQLGEYDEAIRLTEPALAALEADPADHTAAVSMAHGALGVAYNGIGGHATALAHLLRTVALSEALHGPDDLRTLALGGSLSLAHWNAGDPGRALSAAERSHAALRTALGPDHAETRHVRDILATHYESLGRETEAVGLREG